MALIHTQQRNRLWEGCQISACLHTLWMERIWDFRCMAAQFRWWRLLKSH